MKALVGAFNQEKALVGAFSVIVKTGCGTDGPFYSTSSECSHVRAAHLNGNAECRTLITSDAALRPGPGLVAGLRWWCSVRNGANDTHWLIHIILYAVRRMEGNHLEIQ